MSNKYGLKKVISKRLMLRRSAVMSFRKCKTEINTAADTRYRTPSSCQLNSSERGSKMKLIFNRVRSVIQQISVVALISITLTSCGGGGGTSSYNVGGTVTGLAGTGLVLQNNAADDLIVSVDGSFTFSTALANASDYDVTILSQPGSPNQTCTVTNGNGVLAGTEIVDIDIVCETNTYSVGGTVSGLTGSGLVLQNNVADDLTISSDGTFIFSSAITDNTDYSVTVLSNPNNPSQICTVANSKGALAGADVTSVNVTCSINTYNIGGSVTGLAGNGLVLQNNAGDNLSITTDGDFIFSSALADTGSYSVSVLSQPTSPSQTCSVTNSAGVLTGSNISNVSLTCVTNSYSVGGSVAGLAGSGLVLQNNAADDLLISANGDFSFSTLLLDTSSYVVTVSTQPSSPVQTCIVTNNAGSLTGVNVSNVAINCFDNAVPTATSVSVVDNNGGTIVVNDVLSGAYTYTDPESDAEGSSTFRWLRNGVVILGANTSSYTLVSADSGQLITFEITPIALTGNLVGAAVVSSGATVVNSAPAATSISITDDNGGNTVVGDSLTGNYIYNDVDNDNEATSTYRWLRNGAAISGATANTYTLVAADSDQSITFEVTPVAQSGNLTGEASLSGALVTGNVIPTASSVNISDDNGGSVVVTDTLTGSYVYTDADTDAEGSTSFRWLRDGSAISGATSSTYTLVAIDSGTTITFEVTPIAATGTTNGNAVISTGLLVVNSAPTATSVSITDDNAGSAVVGDNLTAGYSYSDIDNDSEGVTTFRWLRDGNAISAATTSTYTLVAADSGTSITLEVTPVASTGIATGSAVVSNGIVVINSAPVATSVTLTDDNSGNTVVGDNLTGNYNYSDVDGDSEGTSTYRWLRNGAAISGATSTTYSIVAADSGQTLSFEVTPIAATGNATGSAVVSSGIAVTNSAPTANSATITDDNSGSVIVGDSLTANYTFADADNDVEGTSTFRWLRNGSVISGATSSTYTLVAADSGTTITFEITPVAATGIASGGAVSSSGITVANSAPVASAVSITDGNGGSIVVGDSLTGNYTYSDIDLDTEGTSTFRWLRDGAAISGATASTYTLIAADSAASITFEITPLASAGIATGSAVVSNGVSVVNSAPVASSVSITDGNGGSVVVGDSLSGNYTYSDVDNDAEGSTTFRWLRDGAAISGATSSAYTLVVADSGTSITFEVTPVASAGVTTGSVVVSSGLSVVNTAPVASAVSVLDNNGGSLVVGDVVTGQYTFSDVDADSEGTSTFRWLRNGAPISGATSLTYTVAIADIGSGTLQFEVTPKASAGMITGTAAVSIGFTVIDTPPTATDVATTGGSTGISGGSNSPSGVTGDTLTGEYTYNDGEGDLEGTSTYRWLRDGVEILGETSISYTTTNADTATFITFEVTPVAATGVTTGSPVVSGTSYVANNKPTASSVTISDNNSGDAVVGDVLTGNYTYSDYEGEAEGTSTFSWLRNGSAISGATSQTYTLVDSDVAAEIQFMVTPVSVSSSIGTAGSTVGSAVTSSVLATGTAPVVSGLAHYLDVNNNGVNDSGDQVVIPFDQDIVVNSVLSTDIALQVTGDSFGTGASVAVGALANELVVTLGTSPALKSRFDFSASSLTAGSASGISSTLLPDSIESASAKDAIDFSDVDLVPGFISGTSTALLGSQVTLLAKGDIDNDGDLDVVSANADSAAASHIYLNNGSAVFTDSGQTLAVTSHTYHVALGDVDNDGDLDIHYSNLSNQANTVFLNDAGTFTDSGQMLGSSGSAYTAFGDVNGDGSLDLVVANFGAADRVYTNDGTGIFTDSGQALGGASGPTQWIDLGDIDNDGDLDYVAALVGASTAPSIYTNNGSGTFTDSGQTLATATEPGGTQTPSFGDIDNDGDLDLVIVYQNDVLRIYSNDGTGTMTDTQQIPLGVNIGKNIGKVTLEDYDNDGDVDILGTDVSNGTRVYTNNGAGVFTDTGMHVDTVTTAMAVGDFDSDGDTDLVSVSNSTTLSVALNSLTATQGNYVLTDTAQTLGTGSTSAVALGDVNGDGDLDLVTVGAETLIYTNNGSGVYTDSTQSFASSDSKAVALADLDGDGDLDIIHKDVYLNNGAGVFTAQNQTLVVSDAIALGDIDNDGDIDIAYAVFGGLNRVYKNDGAGVFTSFYTTPGSTTTFNTIDIALQDIDGDGYLDMISSNRGNPNRIYINDHANAGSFVLDAQELGTSNSNAMTVADFDKDGDLDMFFANYNQTSILYTNNGSGTFRQYSFKESILFTASSETFEVDPIGRVVSGDYDNDGDIDIIVGNLSAEGQIYSNDGSGGFSATATSLGAYALQGLALGDVDGDGDMDLVTGNFSSQPDRVYLNQ